MKAAIAAMRCVTAGLVWAACTLQQATSGAQEIDAEYLRVIEGRAAKIVATLGIEGEERSVRVRDLIASHYRQLRDIDAPLENLAGAESSERQRLEANGQQARFAWHRTFVTRLQAELTPAQVDLVKEGLTYGTMEGTYRHYLELLPTLSDAQRRSLRAHLLEAREYAMDGGSSDAKHQWFRKYKGRINNELAAAGFNMKEAEEAWQAKQGR
ncbi:MAG: DUF3826 domain-containing protein [Planctomycetales bacterium]|nr:DUF3826 domain-containing protein [Planctomycetales bacterium]